MFSRFNSNKCKTQCKLCVSRVKLMRNKRQLSMKQQHKEVADLIRANKQGNARIRVEAVIRDHQTLQAYELIELFLELMAVRVQLIEKTKEMPADMTEAMSSLIYASHRLQDFQELVAIRGMLASKYSKEYVTEATSDLMCRKWHVNEDLIRCLAVDAPSPEEKLSWLSDIAQEHSVEWDAHAAALEMLPAEKQGGYGPPGGGPSFSAGGPGFGTGPGSSSPGFGGGGGGGGGGYQQPQQSPVTNNNSAPFLQGPGATAGGTGQWAPPPTPPAHGPKVNPFLHKADAPSQQTSVNSSFQGVGSSGSGVGQQSSQGGYNDASSAAAAAREYYLQAKLASEAAERWAQGSSSQGGNPASVQYPGGQRGVPNFAMRPPAVPPPNEAQLGVGGTPYGQPLGPGTFGQRSTSDIQRAYDAAPGPPVKGEKGVVHEEGPPSAPPAPGPDRSSSVLPSPPSQPSNSDQKGQKPTNELDDLTQRFEALKRR
ncbi:hypothetical protein ABBQ38_010260 [Trebouxia sp. C0009 RCD-2024]